MNLESIRKKIENHHAGIMKPYRAYAVLVPFVYIEGELHILYEVRSYTMKRQPGEVCFPGGNLIKGESFLDCAIRESCEELGITSEDIEIWGELDVVSGYENNFIHSFAGFIKDIEKIKIQESEVAKIIYLNVKEHINASPEKHSGEVKVFIPEESYSRFNISQDYQWRTGKWESPVYRCQGESIWGLTGRITENVLNLIK